jgi:Kelch motif protein
VKPGPVPGYVLVADRNNDRLLILSPSKKIVWRFPRPGDIGTGQSFHDPDDAFFTPGFRGISTNEEFNDQMALISIRRHRITWSYGRAGVAGSAPGELSNPDDAYVVSRGRMMVADIRNCRVLVVDRRHRILRSYGSPSRCYHHPPDSFGSPNGATPLAGGGVLITEIGGWIDRLDRHGNLVYTVRTPTSYPSDAQLLPDGRLLVAGFDTPGRVDILSPSGAVEWTYGPSSGPASLDRPSLAVRWPNGMIAVTDDWHHRIVVIDPKTKRIVWQYGHFGVASSAPGYLSKPDGLDLLPAAAASARAPAASRGRRIPHLRVRVVGHLPTPAARVSVVALPGGEIAALGGLTATGSSDRVLAGRPSALRRIGTLPVATHDAAAAVLGGSVFLFGGGQTTSFDGIDRLDPSTGATSRVGTIGEPLSDLGAATVRPAVFLVGGYTGSAWATAIQRFVPGHAPSVVARLPAGLRYAGVSALGGRIYVVGGVTTRGTSSAILGFDPSRGNVRRIGSLPHAVAHAALVALGRSLYLIGGTDAAGTPLATILRIDPRTGATSDAGSLPQPLADAGAVATGGAIVVVGGESSGPTAEILEARLT